MNPFFSPATPLETLVHAGNADATLDYLRPLTSAERGRLRPQLQRMSKLMEASRWKPARPGDLHWGGPASVEQQRASHVAILLCGTAEDVTQAWVDAELVIALAQEFELPCLPDLGDALLRKTPNNIAKVQALLIAGVIARPDSDDYALGLIALPHVRRRDKKVRDYFDADPGLSKVILRMFDIEGTGDTSLASIDKYNAAENGWSHCLLSMCKDGMLERSVLLDKTLSALERDWPQYRSGWFSRFHDDLKPTVSELQANAARYLQLCHSRIPPTVSLALDTLATLEASGCIDPGALLSALRPAMTSGSKGQVEAALKLLDRCVMRDPALEADATLICCSGLVHEAAALQARILQRLARRPMQERLRGELRRYLPGIAASNRAAMLRLIGEDDRIPTAAKVVPINTPVDLVARVDPLDAERRLPPIDGVDELIQTIAYVFENDDDIDAFERALAALVVAAPIAATDRARFGPVLKRARKLRRPIALELARLLIFVVEGERFSAVPAKDYSGNDSSIHIRLIARVDALIDLAAQGRRLVPLSSPTHRRGFIAATELIARAHLHQQHGVRNSIGEQVLALLRLAPTATDAERQQARALTDTAFARALRYALGDDIAPGEERALYCAAARIRHPQSDDIALIKAYGDLGPDACRAATYTWQVNSWSTEYQGKLYPHSDLLVRSAERGADVGDLLAVARHPRPVDKGDWGGYRQTSLAGNDPAVIAYSATLVPGDLEAFFAEGARALGNNLDWDEAQWQSKAYLEPLLDPTVTPGPMGTLMLACALAGKEPGQTALAVDCLVRLQAQARFDAALFAATTRRLLSSSLVKAARYRKSLDAALRIEPGLAPLLIDLLSAGIPFDTDPPPKDIGLLLELLYELLLQSGGRLSADANHAIGAMKLGGNGKVVQKKLLAI